MIRKTNTLPDGCVLLFVKLPEKGKVKSRLSKNLDETIVLSLYKKFVLDLVDTLKKGGYSFKICFTPPDSKGKFSDWLGKEYSYMPQKGLDLGERMKNAFIESFSEGCLNVLIIGSDVPDLPNTLLDKALELCNDHAVIGPAFDGGYYLIGFNHNTFLPEIFDGIPWSTGEVFGRTMEIFNKYNHKVHILQKWRDVDSLDDLRALAERNKRTEFADSRTMRFISGNMKRLFT